MALAYDARRATRDIDAVFQPHGVVLDEARAVADELGLTSSEQVLDLCAEIFPEEEVPGRARLVLEDVFEGRSSDPTDR